MIKTYFFIKFNWNFIFWPYILILQGIFIMYWWLDHNLSWCQWFSCYIGFLEFTFKHAFVDRELDRIARTTADLLEEIKALDDPQVAMLLLRMSATPKLNHLSRSMSLYSGPLIAHLVQHDARVAEAFRQLLDLKDLSEPQRAQIHLPIRMGGFGLLSSHFTPISGYFGSFFGCLQEVWLRGH